VYNKNQPIKAPKKKQESGKRSATKANVDKKQNASKRKTNRYRNTNKQIE